jgi:hypothetical protein
MVGSSTVITVSQSTKIRPAKECDAYPITIDDWNLLISKMKLIKETPNYYEMFGSLFVGAALSQVITIICGGYNNSGDEKHIIAWIIAAFSCVVGLLCFIFGIGTDKLKRERINDIVGLMNHIESRFNS